MKGVMIPGVSAGSNHVGASEMCMPQVICPAGCVARAGSMDALAASTRTPSAVAHHRPAMAGPPQLVRRAPPCRERHCLFAFRKLRMGCSRRWVTQEAGVLLIDRFNAMRELHKE